MNNFDYYAPTKVVFGKDTEKRDGTSRKRAGRIKRACSFWRKERDCFWFA